MNSEFEAGLVTSAPAIIGIFSHPFYFQKKHCPVSCFAAMYG
jgi:hypothetical protein